ncbi:MAG: MipA/OmpV family protein [Burkholderiales bacterium]|nr:MipA/OmpV family protein [Burkholderiales bacterium]
MNSLLVLARCLLAAAFVVAGTAVHAGEYKPVSPVRANGETAEATSSGVKRDWDAAVGGVLVYGPDYAGSDNQRLHLGPGFYLRYGRVSIATRSGFRTAGDPGERAGLRIDLSPSDRLRFAVGLRYDAGRQESSGDGLKGMGDVPSTVRVRMMGSYRLDEGWSAGSAVLLDALGRGGGWQADVSFGRQMRFDADTTWSFGTALSLAGDRHMQTYFGVTEEQAARTGYPVYEPRSGLRDVSAFVNARTNLGGSWHTFYGGSVSRLLGPAADSPLTKQPSSWGLNVGLVYRF